MSDEAQEPTSEPGDSTGADIGQPAAGPADVLAPDLRAAVSSLPDLEQAPLTDHIERYQQIHSGLQDALSGIEGV